MKEKDLSLDLFGAGDQEEELKNDGSHSAALERSSIKLKSASS